MTTQIKLKHGGKPDSMFSKRQLNMGIKVEKEHTNSARIAKMIAKAHLVEDKRYYTKLKKAGL
jgi:hypothetical protein